MAPLQKRAWIGLGIGLISGLGILLVVLIKGATNFNDDTAMRLMIDGFWVGGLALYGLSIGVTRRKRGKKEILRDERDEAIMARAGQVQILAIIVSLVIWAIALTEVYWDDGQIPIVFPYLMFIFTLVVNIIAQALGILLGYWRASLDG
ncbi:MAG: hypothetical protein HQ553_12930 [Chloroflexi bacterium]|nr:hypothetical protein [Chloroflexota bacterium]